ncbi:MAG: LCP family protein [Oscillospiraceae bacterium]|nr:LCP family protein [Candidatus Equicaccousia limihippi]
MVSERQQRKKRIITIIAVSLAILLLIGLGLWAVSFFEDSPQYGEGGEEAYTFGYGEVSYKGEKYALRHDVDTLLVIGLDSDTDTDDDSYNNKTKADFVMLCVFDKATGKCHALNFNRDTMTDVPQLGVGGQETSTATEQLALSFTQGSGKKDSCLNVQHAVKNLYDGIVINNYLALNMQAVPIINDAVGGVTVKVEDDFTGIDDKLVQGQTVTLRGNSALTYVRQRQGLENSTNINRISRQQQYLEALFDKAKQAAKNNDNLSSDTLLKINDYMQSSCSVNKLNEITQNFAEYDFSVEQLKGENKKGEEFMEFYCDRDALQSRTIELLYEKK